MRPRVAIPLVLIFAGAVVALGLLTGGPEPAEAGPVLGDASATVKELAKYAGSSAPLNLRLLALERIRKSAETGADTELLSLARKGDLRIAIYATTTLGRRKTANAKATLKTLVTDPKARTEVRMASMTAIVKHWGSADDAGWILGQVSDHAELKAHHAWLKLHVGWK